MTGKVGYSDKLSPEDQVDMKEAIASFIFSYQEEQVIPAADGGDETFTEEDCHDVADEVLYLVLRKFRPDLFDDSPKITP